MKVVGDNEEKQKQKQKHHKHARLPFRKQRLQLRRNHAQGKNDDAATMAKGEERESNRHT